MNLKYKTIGNITPRGKVKVYFCSHPEEIELYLDNICKDIFTYNDCSIWYNDNINIELSEYSDDLLTMSLFVVPITSKFLTTNNRGLEEFKYAISHNIPILPIMKEEGLDELFNKICGEIQYLDPKHKDGSGIKYDDKLKKHLSKILINDDMIVKVKDAFDAYIFLSYRKKDRKYAEKLMKLIHNNEQLQDIAIWYDEFLVPGENFNDAIRYSLKTSDLFLLAVTPNLINENNYILNIEYPLAKEEKKIILPIELVATDLNVLKEKYLDIPSTINVENKDMIYDYLIKELKKVAIESNNTKEHNFFIGLAYLYGIDVEVNYDKGIHLIQSAANEGLIEALDKMIDIYSHGIGTAIDLFEVKKLLEKKVEILINNNIMQSLIETYIDLGDIYNKCLNKEKAKDTYLSVLKLIDDNQLEEKILINNKLGDLCAEDYLNNEAYKYYKKAYEICFKLNKSKNDIYSLSQLSNCYIKLGDMENVNGNIEKAIEWYDKAKNVKQKIVDKDNNNDYLSDLAYLYMKLGSSYGALGNDYELRINYDKAYEIILALNKLPNGGEYGALLIKLMQKYGDYYFDLGKYDDSVMYYASAHTYSEKLVQYSQSASDIFLVITSSLKYGDLNKVNGNHKKAKECYLYALDCARRIHKLCNINKSKELLVKVILSIIDYAENYNEMIKYHDEAKSVIETIDIDKDGNKTRTLISSFFMKTAKLFDKYGKEKEAEDYYYYSYFFIKDRYEENKSLELLHPLANRYYVISKIYYKKQKYNVALRFIEEAYKYISELIKVRKAFNDLRLYTEICIEMTNFYIDNLEFFIKETIEKSKYLIGINNTPQLRRMLYDANYINEEYYREQNNLELANNFKMNKEKIKEVKDYYLNHRKEMNIVFNLKNQLIHSYFNGEYKEIIPDYYSLIGCILQTKFYKELSLDNEIIYSFKKLEDCFNKIGDIKMSAIFKEFSKIASEDIDDPRLNDFFNKCREKYNSIKL